MSAGFDKSEVVAREVEVRPIHPDERRRWDALMDERHCLGFRQFAGRGLRHVAEWRGHWLTLLGWQSGAVQVRSARPLADAGAGTCISGGRPLRGKPPPRRVNRAGQALRMAATSARRNDSCIGACHRSCLRRLDTPRAVKATAHQLTRLVHAMLSRGEECVAWEVADFETERRDRRIRHLQRQARHLNLALPTVAIR